ncbi:SWIM zinc finger family protein [Streptomyces sp. NPDC101160]|uniref:SWIM zinc finger family protein n=1 Tax=Streptomyces sp. NPDC101160 TaxID=3366118 RepID=UPI0038305543
MTPRLPGRPGPRAGALPRHDDRRRTFPQLPPHSAPDGRFAATWWGNAWVDALEDTALDPARLARGKAYAQRGHVDAITVTPGRVVAYVHGSRPRPYRTEIRLRTLGDDDWERFLDEAAARPEHIAALLDKDVPHALEAVTGLLPAPGDLVPDCSCPDDGYPCKHAAALCYQSARLLDEDPFVLFLMRGRGEQELLAALTRRNAARAAAERTGTGTAGPALPSLPARTVLAPTTGHTLPPLPPPLPAPAQPGRPAVFPADPDAPDPLALDLLATEAAARAHAFLTTGHDPVAALTPWQDAVRLAAAHPGSGLTASTRALYRDLAYALDRTPTDLARAVAAWRQGGPAGLAVLEEPWDPPAGPFDRARPALLAADLPAFRPWRNRLSTRTLQLRLGRDGLWYGYESDADREDWWPRGTPDADPVGVITDLLGR